MIVAICTLITLLGLWFVLRKYFTASTTIATLLLLALGTNFFLMSVYSGAVQASILLALMTLVIWMTQRWYEKPGWAEAIVSGLAMGCLIFIKPAGFASIILFLFWGAYNKETFSRKWVLHKDNMAQTILIISLFFAGLVVRLIFPQAFEGSWFSDYIVHKRAVYLLGPWLWLVLFSIRNGWLIYTPVVLFALPGFNILANRNKPIFFAVFLYCLFFLFLLASSPKVAAPDNFSQAKMTEIFAVLIIPLGYFISWVAEGRMLRRISFFLILLALAGLNLFQIWQYRNRILNPWFTSPAYYRAVFLKTHVGPETRLLQDFDNMDMSSFLANESDFNISTLAFAGFENDNGGFSEHIQNKVVCTGKGAMRLDKELMYTPDFSMKLGKLPVTRPLGLRLSAEVYSETEYRDNPADFVITLRHKGQLYRYVPLSLQNLPLEKGKWNSIKLEYVIPRQYDPEDDLIPVISYSGKSVIYVDDLKLELFEPKDK